MRILWYTDPHQGLVRKANFTSARDSLAFLHVRSHRFAFAVQQVRSVAARGSGRSEKAFESGRGEESPDVSDSSHQGGWPVLAAAIAVGVGCSVCGRLHERVRLVRRRCGR